MTGGAGFIGSGLVDLALAAEPPCHVVTLDLLTYAGSMDRLAAATAHPRHTFVRGDVADPELVARLFREHAFDAVVHAAAESHVDRSIRDAMPFVHTNILGTQVLLESARAAWLADGRMAAGACRFHQVSTDEVFGALGPDDPPFTEQSRYDPSSPYSASKAAADHLVRAAGRTYGLPVTLSHGSNTYGPGQHAEKLIPTLVRRGLAGEPMPLYGDGLHVRDWIHLTDHCRGIWAAATRGRPGESYNLGGGHELTNMALARAVCGHLDRIVPSGAPHERHIASVADRPGHDRRYALATDKARGELGWQPEVPVEQGLRDTVAALAERAGKRSR